MEKKKTKNIHVKIAGILNTPKDNLAPNVFDLTTKKLHPHVKAQILRKVLEIFDGDRVKGLFIIGSITGYKWDWDSDIDVNIAIKGFEPSVGKTKMTKQINGSYIKDTQHPINFFVSQFHENTLKYFSSADWGVYEILSDSWLTPPGDPKETKHPKNEYWAELILAKAKSREFDRRARLWKDSRRELVKKKNKWKDHNSFIGADEIQRLERKTSLLYGDLRDFVREVDKDRKKSYSVAFGIGRKSEDNVVFKFIEHGPHGTLFEELKEHNSNKTLNKAEEKNVNQSRSQK